MNILSIRVYIQERRRGIEIKTEKFNVQEILATDSNSLIVRNY